ncbi:hypothetical protein ABE072_06880 [Bacillus paramycoides]
MKKVIILVVSAMVLITGGDFTMEYLKQTEKEENLVGLLIVLLKKVY